ncbi:MAG: molybdenum cofactor synthesis domain-containing protein, partial [Halobacteria archaeon]|nr:molybdenum cofactor synthesis domain-containing protein [Halobacteria archaeon]
DRSKMDGYAVRSRDTFGATESDPVVLEITGEAKTGEGTDLKVEERGAVKIPTGGPIPEGADSVVKVENTVEEDGKIRVEKPVAPADNVMVAGYDIPRGRNLIKRGERLTPRKIGILCAAGIDALRVFEKPKVGVISTGDELVRPGNELSEAQVYDVNTFTLANAVREHGGEPDVYDHLPDERDTMEETLLEAADECDLIISSGSTSASDEDVLYRIADKRGDLLAHGVSLKPGRPTFLAVLEDVPYLGLPGNPISALMAYNLLGSRLIGNSKAVDLRGAGKSKAVAKTPERISSHGGRTRLVPVGLVKSPEKGLLAHELDRGSGATTTLSEAEGYVVVGEETEYIEENDRVEVELFGDGTRPPDLLGYGEREPGFESLLGPKTKWIETSVRDGVRKLKNGVADVTSFPNHGDHGRDLGGSYVIRGFEREIGVVGDDDSDTLGVYPGVESYVPGEVGTVSFRRQEEVVHAVKSGKIDAGLS